MNKRIDESSESSESSETATFSGFGRTYVKTKNREVEPTSRHAAVHTGRKALGLSESEPPAGILSPSQQRLMTAADVGGGVGHSPSWIAGRGKIHA